MTSFLNRGDRASFFATQQQGQSTGDLISNQVDPTQPQVAGLTGVTDPLVPDRQVSDRLGHLDPSLFDLRDSSHLMRLLKALLGAAGAGGLRKQTTLARTASGSLSGTHFLDLDTFWGVLFQLSRNGIETMPQGLNPNTDVADSDVWDDIAGRDGRYRSRLSQFARAVDQGATYYGVIAAAEALLGIEVDLIESWTLADQIRPGQLSSELNTRNYFAVNAEYSTYGNMRGVSWASLQSDQPQVQTQDPLGNRGEIVLRPKRAISQADKRQVGQVLEAVLPAGTHLTVVESGQQAHQQTVARRLSADSQYWDVGSVVSARVDLQTTGEPVYPSASARPAFSAYDGESWSYNAKVASVTAYEMVEDRRIHNSLDHQRVTYLDGQVRDYLPVEAVMSAHQAGLARAASEGIMTVYPFRRGGA